MMRPWIQGGLEAGIKSSLARVHPERLKALVAEAGLGAYADNVGDAALFGELILFSPNFWGVAPLPAVIYGSSGASRRNRK
jgi:hypothetical protein